MIKTCRDLVYLESKPKVERNHPSGGPTRPAQIDYSMFDRVVPEDLKQGDEVGPPTRFGADAALQVEAVSVPETPR